MAGKPQNRHELRRQYDAAEPLDPMEDESEDLVEDGDDEEERRPKKKPKAPVKAKAKVAKPVKPAARMRIVWAVVNDAFKPIATFDYNQKDAAQAKADEMTARGKGTHFIQKVKEAMPDNAPGLGAAIPRPAPEATPAPVVVADSPSTEEDDEAEAEDDDEEESDADSDEPADDEE